LVKTYGNMTLELWYDKFTSLGKGVSRLYVGLGLPKSRFDTLYTETNESYDILRDNDLESEKRGQAAHIQEAKLKQVKYGRTPFFEAYYSERAWFFGKYLPLEDPHLAPKETSEIVHQIQKFTDQTLRQMLERLDGAKAASITFPIKTTIEQTIEARRGQDKFREALLARSKKCELTGIGILSALKASHIKPWSTKSRIERMDPDNGILLVANADALFDKGLISFDKSGRLIRSKKLKNDDLRALGIDPMGRIKVWPKREQYLNYHRTKLLQQ
jgi:hypothetical protein